MRRSGPFTFRERRKELLTEESTGGPQQMVQEKTQQAKEQVQKVTGSAQDRIREQVDTRSTEAGHQVDSVGQAMRTAGEQLRGQGNELPAKVAEQLAQRAEQLGGYLRESDADRILGDLENFARRQPWVVAAMGLALGVAGARFLKASGRRRYTQSQSQPGAGSAPNGGAPTGTYPAPDTHPDPAAGSYAPPPTPRY
jgi:ElaB/YqjD/DUF883 family membrane-anchored ribosome-binding protein